MKCPHCKYEAKEVEFYILSDGVCEIYAMINRKTQLGYDLYGCPKCKKLFMN